MGNGVMPFTTCANQHDIAAMTEALDAYCRECAITDESDRTLIAQRIAALFFSGHATSEDILGALRASDREGKPSRAA